MTKEEINEINRLKKDGIGYKKIAKYLNLSINSVKSYLSRSKNKRETYCLNCGLKIINKPKIKTKKFCSCKCKRKYIAHHPEYISSNKAIERTCPNCGEKFICYKSINKKFCTHKCYIEFRYKKDSELNE